MTLKIAKFGVISQNKDGSLNFANFEFIAEPMTPNPVPMEYAAFAVIDYIKNKVKKQNLFIHHQFGFAIITGSFLLGIIAGKLI